MFEILTCIVRKCYQMYAPREFFDQLMSPFILQPIFSFTFSAAPVSGSDSSTLQAASKQGCQFLRALFTNMFIAEPHEAFQDVMEVNFGFQVESIAGMTVPKKEGMSASERKEEKGQPMEDAASDSAVLPESDKSVPAEVEEQKTHEPKDKAQKEATQSEFSAMKQEELAKERILAGAARIYELHEVNPLLAQ